MKVLAMMILALTVSCFGTARMARAALAPAVDQDDDAGAEGDERGDAAKVAGFVEPAGAGAVDPALDPTHVIPAKLLATALEYFHQNAARIANKDVLTVVDFSASNHHARMFLLDMQTGAVTALHVAHGSGSDPRSTGFATIFRNDEGSNCSSLGFYLTAETYSGKHGYSLRLDGLSATNSAVRQRAVVIHGADYVHDADVAQGRSWGCLAVSMQQRTAVIDRLKSGSLIYAGQSAN